MKTFGSLGLCGFCGTAGTGGRDGESDGIGGVGGEGGDGVAGGVGVDMFGHATNASIYRKGHKEKTKESRVIINRGRTSGACFAPPLHPPFPPIYKWIVKPKCVFEEEIWVTFHWCSCQKQSHGLFHSQTGCPWNAEILMQLTCMKYKPLSRNNQKTLFHGGLFHHVHLL